MPSPSINNRRPAVATTAARPPLYVRDSMWTDRVWKALLERGAPSALVVDDGGRLVGQVFRSDLPPARGEDGVLADELTALPFAHKRLVRQVMRSCPHVLPESASTAEAVACFQETGAEEIAIVDADGVLIGVVVREDVDAGIGPSAPVRVLVVDDDHGIRESLGDLFAEEGYEVGVAENGAAALACMRSRKPDVVLLDLMMPVMNGWELLDRLDEHPGDLGAIPVIVMSAVSAPLSSPKGRGVRAWFNKPLDPHEILGTVRGLTDPRTSRGGSG